MATCLLRHLTKCQEEPSNQHVKSIVRPERVMSITCQHFANFKPPFFQVNADKVRFSGPFFPNGPVAKLRINHYWTGDMERFINVKIPNQIMFWGQEYSKTCWQIAETINCRPDFTIHKYIDRLQRKMNRSASITKFDPLGESSLQLEASDLLYGVQKN